MSARDAILSARALEEVVDGPAGPVLVRGLSVTGKDGLQQRVLGHAAWRPYILRSCCFDPESREPLFTAEDVLDDVQAQMVEPYVDAAIRLSALPPKEIEELEGNSGGTPSNGTEST